MFQQDLTNQSELFSRSARDLVPDDSDVWLYVDIFDQLDLNEFSFSYCGQGQQAKDPCFMLRTIFYGLTHGVVSGRKLEEACRYDNRYRILCGDRMPVQSTIHRFLIRHAAALEDLFAAVVRLAQKMELASLGRVSLDGSRFKANTSKHKAMTYERMEAAIARIKAELDELRSEALAENAACQGGDIRVEDEIKFREKRLQKISAAKAALEEEKQGSPKPTDQKSFHDHEAKPMARKGKEFQYGYNCQAAVDADNQIVVAAEVLENSSDAGCAGDMIDHVEAATGKKPDQLLADAGYKGADDLHAIETRGVEALVSMGKGETQSHQIAAEQITRGSEEREYKCLAGKVLTVKSRHEDGSTTLEISGHFCKGCRNADFCKLRLNNNRRVKILAPERQATVNAVRARMRTDEAKKTYKERKAVVEPVFGNLKNKGIRIAVKGKKRVKTWWKIAVTAHNLEKIAHAMV